MIINDNHHRKIIKGTEKLTPEDIAQGWHFCPDFDNDLTCTMNEDSKDCLWCDFTPKEIK